MGRHHTGFRYMRSHDWGWFVATFISGVVLPITLIANTNPAQAGTMRGILIISLLCMMAFGGTLSVIGIYLRGTRHRPLIVGYAMEVGGVIALILAPALLSIVYGVNTVISGTTPTGSMLSLAIAAPYTARLLDIVFGHLAPRKRRGSSDSVDQSEDG